MRYLDQPLWLIVLFYFHLKKTSDLECKYGFNAIMINIKKSFEFIYFKVGGVSEKIADEFYY